MPGSARILKEQMRLCLVTDESLCRGRNLVDVVLSAIQGGVTSIQLREKALPTREFVSRAQALKSLLAPLNVPLIVNDRVDVALACEADGVHLGQSDMPIELARRLLPPQVFIGLSVETDGDVERANGQPVDYLGVSPLFATATKLDTVGQWGLEGLRRARCMTDIPLVAIGGIHWENAADVIRAGADGLAVVSAICAATDPARAAALLLAASHPHFLKGTAA